MGLLKSLFFKTTMPNKPTPFVRKTFELVSDQSTNPIVGWSSEGTSFLIYNPQEFQTKILPRYFKHKNLCSFVRQLNTYGFKKVNNPTNSPVLEFQHPHFEEKKRSMLGNIVRR